MKIFRVVRFHPEHGEVRPVSRKMYTELRIAKGARSVYIGNAEASIPPSGDRRALRDQLERDVFIQDSDIEWAKVK